MHGAELLVECLRVEGVEAVFGNPGNSELALVAAAERAGAPPYYLALHEVVAVGMAAGHAIAQRAPGVVNVHSAPGLGNAMSNLYNAWRARTPLVVIAGQQDTRNALDEPLLHADLVGQVRGYTKWAWEVTRVEDVPGALRRAFKEAACPPKGPVFLSLPMEVAASEVPDGVRPQPSTRLAAPGVPSETLERAAALLRAARRPALIVGSRVDDAGAVDRAVQLAEALGAPVWVEPFGQQLSFPHDHDLFAGHLPRSRELVRDALDGVDAALVAGAEAFLMIPPYEPGWPLPDGARLVHLDDSAEVVGLRHAPDVGVVGKLAGSLAALAASLGAAPPENRDGRRREVAEANARRREDLRAASAPSGGRMRAVEAFAVLAEAWRDCIVVDEAVSLSVTLRQAFELSPPAERFGNRTGGLGWGVPAALGVAVARPGWRVLCVVGDGSALYAPQGLWTAAHYGLPVTFVVLDNGGYDINRMSVRHHLADGGASGFPGSDIDEPSLDWEALACGFGVTHCVSVSDSGEVAEAAQTVPSGEPALLRLEVASNVVA